MKQTNRIAWGLAAVLAVVVLATLALGWQTRQWGRMGPTVHSSAGPGVWPLFRANTTNTGSVRARGPLKPSLKWSSPTLLKAGGVTDIAPVLASDGTLYCVCEYAAYAVRADGTIRWTYQFPGRDFGGLHSPAVGNGGIVFVTTEKHYSDMTPPWDWSSNEPGLYALGPDGKLLWKYAAAEPATSPLIDKHGTIYLATLNNQVVALSPGGRVLRRWSVTADKLGSIAIDEGGHEPKVFYLGGPNLYLLLSDGRVRKASLHGTGGAAVGLAVSERRKAAYALFNSGTLAQVDTGTLREKWRFRLKGEVNAHPAVADAAIYAGCSDHNTLYAISHSGRLLWRFTLPGGLHTAPAVDGRGDIYVTVESEAEKKAYLYCVKTNGSLRWRLGLPEPFGSLSSPIIGDNETVYCFFTRAFAVHAAKL